MNGSNAGAKYPTYTIPKTGQKLGDILKMGIILIKSALKNVIGLMKKPTFL